MRKRKVDGEKLREIREYQWLSQGELGEKAGVALHTISRIEKGRTPYPQSTTLLSIARALGVDDPHELLEAKQSEAERR
jgi:transcriptional regulator with XRE-family HTH domain